MNSVQIGMVRESLQSLVSTRGRFYGERIWVPYFWELIGLAGGSTLCVCSKDAWHCPCPTAVMVSDEDRAVFPELVGARRVNVFERSDGTVGGYVD